MFLTNHIIVLISQMYHCLFFYPKVEAKDPLKSFSTKKISMRVFLFLFSVFLSLSLQGQKIIGFPFKDRDQLGFCPVCEIKDSTDIIYLSNFDQILNEKFGRVKENHELYLRKINFVESILKQTSLSTAVRVKLLNTVIDWYCLDVIDNYEESSEIEYEDSMYTVYNNSLASANELINFSGPLKIIQLYDEIIALPIDENSRLYYKNLKLAYCAQSRIIKLVNDRNSEWIVRRLLPQNLNGDERKVAQNFLTTMNETDYNPFVSYKTICPGINTSSGKDFWYGFELSYDPYQEFYKPRNPKHPFLGYKRDYRGSLLGIKLLVNPNLSKKDILFSVMDYHLTDYIYMNPFQFGWHLYGLNKNEMFMRPEFGIHYSIFTLTYGYNYTFNEETRPFTEKHMVNFTISYPLLRLGKYH